MHSSYTKSAAFFMMLLVAWDTTEFALQAVKRPIEAETGILFCTLSILVCMVLLFRSTARWTRWAALAANGLQCFFGVFGIFDSPMNQGFGKIGPGVAALLTGIAIVYGIFGLRAEDKNVSSPELSPAVATHGS